MSNEKILPTRWDGQPEPMLPMKTLGTYGKKMWHHLIDAIPKRILCSADSATLTMMCKAWNDYVIFQKKVEESVKTDEKMDWNLFSAMKAAQNQFNRGAKVFGLSPLERNKITPQGTGRDLKPDNDKDEKPAEEKAEVPPPAALTSMLGDLEKVGSRFKNN